MAPAGRPTVMDAPLDRPSPAHPTDPPSRRRATPSLVPLLLALLLIALPTPGGAQPYAAAGGFDRPQLVATLAGVPSAALAVEEGDVVYGYWDDGEGVVRLSLTEPDARPERLVEDATVRLVRSVTVDGDVAVGWVSRNRENGRSEMRVAWRGETRLIEPNLKDAEVALAAAPGGPAALSTRQRGSESLLLLTRWGEEPRLVRRSEQTLARFSLRYLEGRAHLALLEGVDARTLLGPSSDWRAIYLELDEDGAPSREVELGPAANRGRHSATRVDLAADGPLVMWTHEDGRLLSTVPGATTTVLGRGLALGVAGEHLYWVDADAFMRAPVGRADLAENVVWSPNVAEDASLVTTDGRVFILWYGPAVGGGFALYRADDRRAIRLGWQDRLAASMGWNPWTLWQEATGQALASALTAVIVTVALLPLFWGLAALVGARIGARAGAGWGVGWGVGIGGVSLSLLTAVAAWRGGLAGGRLVGVVGLLLVSLALSAAVGWWLTRRVDSEVQMRILLAASTSAAVGLMLFGFLTYGIWSDAFGFSF